MTLTSQAKEIIERIDKSNYPAYYIGDYREAKGLLIAWKDWLNYMFAIPASYTSIPEELKKRFYDYIENNIKDLTSAIKILEDGGVKI